MSNWGKNTACYRDHLPGRSHQNMSKKSKKIFLLSDEELRVVFHEVSHFLSSSPCHKWKGSSLACGTWWSSSLGRECWKQDEEEWLMSENLSTTESEEKNLEFLWVLLIFIRDRSYSMWPVPDHAWSYLISTSLDENQWLLQQNCQLSLVNVWEFSTKYLLFFFREKMRHKNPKVQQ